MHVLDVARALAHLASVPPVPRVLSLPGPQSYTIEYMLELISSVTFRPVSRSLHLPKSLAKFMSKVSGLVWWPVLSPDQIERRYIDDAGVTGDWDVFGFAPDALEQHILTYLQMYRSS